jgi:hypothetical protein
MLMWPFGHDGMDEQDIGCWMEKWLVLMKISTQKLGKCD